MSNDPTNPNEVRPLRIKAEADTWTHPQPVAPLPSMTRFPPPLVSPLPAEWSAPGASTVHHVGPVAIEPLLVPPAPLSPPTGGSTRRPPAPARPAAAFGPPVLPSEPTPDLRRRKSATLAPPVIAAFVPRAGDGTDLGTDLGPSLPDLGVSSPRQSRLRSFAAPIGSRRRHAAAAARVVAVGLSTTGFVVGIASLATAQPEGEIRAESPDATAGTIVQTRTVHRTVYVDEQGNPVPEYDPSIAQAAIESAVVEASRATGDDSPWPAPAMIPGVEASADEVAAAQQSSFDAAVARPDSNGSTRASGQGSQRIPAPTTEDTADADPDADPGVADENTDIVDESADETAPDGSPSSDDGEPGLEDPVAGDAPENQEPEAGEPAVTTTASRPASAPTTASPPTTTRPATTTTRPATTTTRPAATTTQPATTTSTSTTTTAVRVSRTF